MPLDESIAFYWASLGLSAAGVILFLWLVRVPKAAEKRDAASRVTEPPKRSGE